MTGLAQKRISSKEKIGTRMHNGALTVPHWQCHTGTVWQAVLALQSSAELPKPEEATRTAALNKWLHHRRCS